MGMGGDVHETTSTNHVKQARTQRPLAKLCIIQKAPSTAQIFSDCSQKELLLQIWKSPKMVI
jgi:hypothetical protein